MFQWIFCIRPSSGSKQQHLDVENSACVTKEKVNKSFNMLIGGGCARKWSIDPKHQNIMVGVKLDHHTLELAKIFPSSSSWGCTWLYSLSTFRGNSFKLVSGKEKTCINEYRTCTNGTSWGTMQRKNN